MKKLIIIATIAMMLIAASAMAKGEGKGPFIGLLGNFTKYLETGSTYGFGGGAMLGYKMGVIAPFALFDFTYYGNAENASVKFIDFGGGLKFTMQYFYLKAQFGYYVAMSNGTSVKNFIFGGGGGLNIPVSPSVDLMVGADFDIRRWDSILGTANLKELHCLFGVVFNL